jgi:hypothetical protein
MKKVLYGTTALVAAGAMAAVPAAAEEGVTLGLGGYYNAFFGFGGFDEASNEPRDFNFGGFFADGEVHFKGKTTLDNGITFGVQIELEAFQSGDQIDENYAFIEGSFGRAVIGGENSAAYMMAYGAPNVGVPLNSGWITVFIAPPPGSTTGFRTPALSTYVDLQNDTHGITYYSPRFSGFQIAGSWFPTPTPSGDGRNSPVFADTNFELNNVLSIGANFVETFGDFDVALSGGFNWGQAADFPPGVDDPTQYRGGLVLGYAGFSVGGSVAFEDSDFATDGTAYDVGASYSTGPWAVGVTWFASEVEGTSGVGFGSEDELAALEVGVSYAVGPGITASLSGIWAEWEEESGTDQSGIVGVVGMKIGF